MKRRVEIARLSSGVEGLDAVLGGGVPELSFNLIAGGPGSGKTTLAHQMMFASASVERPALYVTIVGEPPLKMLRYQQQYDFFDESKIGHAIRFLHVGQEVLARGLDHVLAAIVSEVATTSPKLVFVDSFRSTIRGAATPGKMDDAALLQQLAAHLTAWEATTFLIGEYDEQEDEARVLFTVADGILWLRQTVERSSIVRRAQVLKMRGQAQIPGLHTFRISNAGLRVYPRMLDAPPPPPTVAKVHRLRTGVGGLDAMMGGGLPAGHTMMVVGPTGSGKSLVSTQFILEGIANGEPGVIAVFEKRPEEYLQSLPNGKQLAELVAQGSLRMMYLRPLDLSVEETMEELRMLVHAIGAKRIVIDSLSGFQLALAPAYREDFRESLYRMLGALTGLGVTVVMTAEMTQSTTELRLGAHGVSFLADAIVLQRYVETASAITRAIAVVKLRGYAHSSAVHAYVIDGNGVNVGAPQSTGARSERAGKRPSPVVATRRR